MVKVKFTMPCEIAQIRNASYASQRMLSYSLEVVRRLHDVSPLREL